MAPVIQSARPHERDSSAVWRRGRRPANLRAMLQFISQGQRLAYDDIAPEGTGRGTVALVHGFASNRTENWRRLGWYAAFSRAGFRIVALDLRGHGQSDKPHDPQLYQREALASDILALLDAAKVPSCILMGYSLGAHLSLAAALAAPERIDKLILGGVGGRLMAPPPPPPAMSLGAALLIEDPSGITDPIQQGFRRFADAQGDDRAALAACSQGVAMGRGAPDLGHLTTPTLVAAGANDSLAGDPADLAAHIKDARAVALPGCDHFSAIPHALFRAAVFDFLDDFDAGDDFVFE